MKTRMVSSVPPWNAGQRERLGDEAAERLDLGIDHLHDLAGRDVPEVGQGKRSTRENSS